MLFAGLMSVLFIMFWSIRYGRHPTRSLAEVLLLKWDDIRFLGRGIQYFYFLYYDVFLLLFHILVIFFVIVWWYKEVRAEREMGRV